MLRAARIAPAVAVVLVAMSPWMAPASASASAARRGADYIASQQMPDGGFFFAGAPADFVSEALASALAAGGAQGITGPALAYLQSHGPARAAERPAYAGRIVMGLIVAGRNPRAFAGTDYVALAKAKFDGVSGVYDAGNEYANALAALGVLAAGEDLPESAVRHMRLAECPGGGFGAAAGCVDGADTDTTSAVVSALVASGVPPADAIFERATTFLRSVQSADGGFGYSSKHAATNANSTGLAISAIRALGRDPGAREWRRDASPVVALLRLQQASGGFAVTAARTRPDGYATVQAIPGVAGLSYPLRSPRAAATDPATRRAQGGAKAPAGSHAPSPTATVVASAPGSSPKAFGSFSPAPAPPSSKVLAVRTQRNATSRTFPIGAAVAALSVALALTFLRSRRTA